ncbi:tRNA (adenosine(37)-N6)-threonylcarbamoyltransferase complex ATPase subunit type 1 TsaE [Patescibacteria group bacterium]|nr:tRNA (adenosine(37)-N6)-threonylcarbamoyltransferase complex ATPase subunit type 1 TsaE [Patescibacteria group bacterium]MBU0964044.1 tRNA (adenosine(37)-N6)-threonylcarbamoyltransferase complex ATPase subunit type 1 TsaE [Patescibacteria group bacterium]
MIIISKSAKETEKLGLRLAKKAKGGQIYALIGDLGGGKTCFTKGFAKGLGIPYVISSPSYVLMNIFKLRGGQTKFFCHVDTYRLSVPEEIIEVGLLEHLNNKQTITVIEWADKINKILGPYKKITISFKFIDYTTRKIKITKTTRKNGKGY